MEVIPKKLFLKCTIVSDIYEHVQIGSNNEKYIYLEIYNDNCHSKSSKSKK